MRQCSNIYMHNAIKLNEILHGLLSVGKPVNISICYCIKFCIKQTVVERKRTERAAVHIVFGVDCTLSSTESP